MGETTTLVQERLRSTILTESDALKTTTIETVVRNT